MFAKKKEIIDFCHFKLYRDDERPFAKLPLLAELNYISDNLSMKAHLCPQPPTTSQIMLHLDDCTNSFRNNKQHLILHIDKEVVQTNLMIMMLKHT